MLCCSRKKLAGTQAQVRDDYWVMLRETQLLRGSNFWGQDEKFHNYLLTLLPQGVKYPGEPFWFDQNIHLTQNTDAAFVDTPPLLKAHMTAGVRIEHPSFLFKQDYQLFKQDKGEKSGVHFSDVNQGFLSNCWLMASLGALARYGKAPGSTKSVIETLFLKEWKDEKGTEWVKVKLNQPKDSSPSTPSYGEWVPGFEQDVTLKIPVYLPKVAKPPTVAYVKSKTPGELWPCMLEKAIAVSIKNQKGDIGYPGAEGGFGAVGMAMFVPGIPVCFRFPEAEHRPDPTELFNAWEAMLGSGISILIMWRVMDILNKTNDEKLRKGLVTNHVYVVLGVKKVDNLMLCLMRNPWGKGNCAKGDPLNGEWTGDWSDCSPLWKDNKKMRDAFGFGSDADDGVFWMPFYDISKHIRDYDIFIPSDPELRHTDLKTPEFVANANNLCPRPAGWCNKADDDLYEGLCKGQPAIACRHGHGKKSIVLTSTGCGITENPPDDACPEFFGSGGAPQPQAQPKPGTESTSCGGITCPSNSHCDNQYCVCDVGFFGENCAFSTDRDDWP